MGMIIIISTKINTQKYYNQKLGITLAVQISKFISNDVLYRTFCTEILNTKGIYKKSFNK